VTTVKRFQLRMNGHTLTKMENVIIINLNKGNNKITELRYGGDHYDDNFDIDIDMEDISMQYMGNRPFVRSRETRPHSSNYCQNDRTSWS